jgi:hypothetical protein
MALIDQIQAKVDELDLPHKAEQLTDAAMTTAREALTKVGELADENRAKIDGFLDKAASTLNEKTEGKYADKVAKAQAAAAQGVAYLAEQRGAAGASSGAEGVAHEAVATPAVTGDTWAQATDPTGGPGATGSDG